MTINQAIFQKKVETFKEAGLTQWHIFEGSIEFSEVVDSGFLQWMLENYHHDATISGFKFHLENKLS